MNHQHLPHRFLRIGLAAALVAAAGMTFSAEAAAQAMPSKEMREKMAVVHEQIAACLRSEKTIAECRTETMQKCQAAMGHKGCQGMGMGAGMGMANMGMMDEKSRPAQSTPQE